MSVFGEVDLMRRKTLVALVLSIALIVMLATPRFGTVAAWGVPASIGNQQRTQINNIGDALGAPFRAIGKLFGGGKKNKPATKITEKDIKKFESSQLSRVKDSQRPITGNAAANTPASVTTAEAAPAIVDHLRQGREFLEAGQLNEAIAELTLAVSIDPKSGDAQTLLGVAYDRKGLGARAREAFEAAVHGQGDRAMHLNNLGFLLYRQGYFDDAIKYLKTATKINSDDNRIWDNLAIAQLADDRFDDAYKSSVHVRGEFESRLKIAQSLDARGKLKEAIKYLEKARAIQPKSTEALSQLATLYDRTGQEEKSLSARQSLNALLTVAVQK
jgi:Flp pilus assembly protein TadD